MRILVACEESQAVTKELRRLGHEAYSCDIIECSGGHPEWHIMQDVLPLVNGHCEFDTMDGESHLIDQKWDMLIAFPPCTHIAVSGARHFTKKLADGRMRDGVWFFCQFLHADCERVAIENPVNIIHGTFAADHFPDLAAAYGLPAKSTQHIQPYMFGDPFRKKTNLWLKGLPNLEATEVVKPLIKEYVCKTGKIHSFSADYGSGSKTSGQRRSKTYPGIARAMAEQWAGKCEV